MGIFAETRHPGNSGGPLLNQKGKVIGVATLKMLSTSQGERVEGINFAIASSVVKNFMGNKLTNLEEVLKRKEEELKQKDAERKKEVYEYADSVYNHLSSVWISEYNTFYNKIVWIVERGSLSVEQGKRILQTAVAPPRGFSSVADWIGALTVRVVKGEISENEAERLIRGTFAI